MASTEEIGPQCTKNSIVGSALLSYVSKTSDTTHCIKEAPTITNALVLELIRFKNQHSQCTFKTLHNWIKDLFGKRWPEGAPTPQAITKSIERLGARLSKLKKQHTTEEKDVIISDFLQQEYFLPKLGFCQGRVLHFSPAKQPTARCLTETQEEHVKKCKELKQKMYAVTRNANKRLKRRDEVIHQQKQDIKSQREAIKSYEKKLKGAESQLSKLKAKLDRINHRASYWRARADHINDKYSNKGKELRNEIESLREKTSSLSLDNAEMSETLESILTSKEITTFESGRYTDDVRACIYELLSLNVGVRNIAPTIKCVLKNIAHKSVSRLPSYGLTCQMILESLTVVQAQLGDKLSDSSCNTLQTDGTTKFGEHYATYDVRTSYTLGLRHVFSGSAQDTLETMKEILDDIDNVQLALGKDAVSGKIIAKLKNTMSDRHAAEKLFNELLHDFRAEILPTIAENWDHMTEIEKEQLTNMNKFFCGLHFLVGLADTAEATIKLWEAHSTSKGASASSGTQRLVRTACKAFHHRGSPQCGCSTLFRTYLKKQGIYKIPLAQFVGNRFNILFYDAAGVYYLQSHMLKFIESVHGRQANLLLQAVQADLKEPVYISGCRALGLVDKLVTGPLWRKIQQSSTSVLEMGDVYCRMKEKFDSWSGNANALIEGSAILLHDVDIHVDEVWTALIESNQTDTMTQELLQLLFGAFSVTTQRLLLDHLPGGKYYSVVDTEMIHETASVPTTNISPERDFAILDRLLREKPNVCLVSLEAMILYSHNKSSLWLQQTSEERHRLIQAAQTLAPAIRLKFKARRQEIERRHEEALMKKQEAIVRKELHTIQEKEKLTKKMEKVGLWMNRAEVEEGIEALSKIAEKREVLELQINFRRKVLGQSHPDNSVFRFSLNRKQHSVCQLKQNLYKLLAVDLEHSGSEDQNQGGNEDQGDSSPSRDDIIQQPELLVGQKIKHCFKVDGELVWYDGNVLQMNSETNEFQVAYSGEEDASWFPLLEDIISGDLYIIS